MSLLLLIFLASTVSALYNRRVALQPLIPPSVHLSRELDMLFNETSILSAQIERYQYQKQSIYQKYDAVRAQFVQLTSRNTTKHHSNDSWDLNAQNPQIPVEMSDSPLLAEPGKSKRQFRRVKPTGLNQSNKAAEKLLKILRVISNQSQIINTKLLRCMESKEILYHKINELLHRWWQNDDIDINTRFRQLQQYPSAPEDREYFFSQILREYQRLQHESKMLVQMMQNNKNDDPLHGIYLQKLRLLGRDIARLKKYLRQQKF